MNDLRFIDNVNIILSVKPGTYVNIKPDQLSENLRGMIAKQIYPSQDLILKVHISPSSLDPEHSVSIATVCWDGRSTQYVHGKHTDDGTYERIAFNFQ